MYLRTIDRHTRNELCDQTSWGGEGTYDHTRKPTKGGMCNGKGKRNDYIGTLRNRNNYSGVNCAGRDEVLDNENDFD